MKLTPARRLNGSPLQLTATLLAVGIALWLRPASAALDAGDTKWDGSQPPQGVYFYWYEPSFYTGFAPRTQDPQRLHIRLSRGNQVRAPRGTTMATPGRNRRSEGRSRWS